MADENNATYKDGLPAIEKAITDIGKASSEEEVQELLDKAIKGVSEETKKAMEDLEKEKTDALADLQKYLEASDNLNDEDKARLQSFVTEASKKIKTANSERVVSDAVATFNELMGASKTLETVAVQKAKNDAKAALEECRDESKPALNKLIDEAIEEIEEMDTVDAITQKMESLLNNPGEGEEGELGSIIKLKNAQKIAYEELKAYEDYLTTNTTLSVAEKQSITDEINTVKELIDNAGEADNIYKYSGDTLQSGAMYDFRTFMSSKYKTTDDAVKLEIAKDELEATYQDYLTKLAPYLTSSDANIKAIAQKAKTSMKEIAEPEVAFKTADEITNNTTGALKKLEELYKGKGTKNTPEDPQGKAYSLDSITDDKDTNFVGYEQILKHNDDLVKEADKVDKEAREAAYENAIEVLDLYETVLKDSEAIAALKLSEDDITSIQSMINATRSTVAKATGAIAINDAMQLLKDSTTVNAEDRTGFLDKYYPEYAEYANNYEFNHAKTTALTKLEEYKTTYANDSDLLAEINSAYTEIEGYTVTRHTVKEINDKLTSIENDIDLSNKTKLLEAEKTRLVNKYNEVLTNTKDNGVKADAQEAIAKVQQVTLSKANEFEAKMKKLSEIEKEYDDKVKDALDDIADQKETEKRTEATRVNTIIDEYISIATASGRNSVVTALNNYKNSVNTAEDADAVKEVETLMNAYIDNSCRVLKLQYTAVTNLNNLYNNKYNGNDVQIKAVIDEGITAIKAIKVDNWNDEATMKTEIEKIAKFASAESGIEGKKYYELENTCTVKTKIGEIETNRTNLENEKKKAIGTTDDENSIKKAIEKYSTKLTDELNTYVADILAQINAVTSDDEEFTEIKRLRDLAKKNIAEYVKGGLVSQARNEDNSVAATGTIKGDKSDTSIQASVNVTASSVQGVNFDVEGTLTKIDTDWNDLSISNKTGYFVALKITNKYAKEVTAKLNGADTDVEVISTDLDNDGSVIVIVRVADTSASGKLADGKKLTISYKATAEDETTIDEVYLLSGLKSVGE